MDIMKKFVIYLMLTIILFTVGCEGGCDQNSPTSPEQTTTK